MTVSTTIFDQLGGNRFVAMTGAKNFVKMANGLQFRIGKNKSKANLVVITLANDDTYNVEYFNVRGIDYKSVGFVNGIYADGLRDAFTHFTGLHTSL